MRTLAFIFVFSLIFFSCEKDKERQLVIENSDIPLISKVLIGGETYMEYAYNEANLLTEEKSKFHYSKHFYNDNNQLIESDFYWDISMASSNIQVIEAAMSRTEWVNPTNTPKDISHVLEYNRSGQVIRKSYIRPSGNYTDFVEFTYAGDKIIRITGYNNNAISGYTDYTYDINGNIIKEIKYVSPAGITELSTTTDYEYDNMHNPYQSFKRLITPGVYTNPNNITKTTYTLNFDVDSFTEKVQLTENHYEYNAQGYPVRVNGITEYVYK